MVSLVDQALRRPRGSDFIAVSTAGSVTWLIQPQGPARFSSGPDERAFILPRRTVSGHVFRTFLRHVEIDKTTYVVPFDRSCERSE